MRFLPLLVGFPHTMIMTLKSNKIFIQIFVLVLTLNFNVFASQKIYWNAQSFLSRDIADIAYLNGTFVVTSEAIYTSNDAKQWELTFSPAIDGAYNEVYVLNNQFIAIGENVQPIKSTDGITWSPIRLHENISPKDIDVIGDTFFWSSSPTSISYSKNLLTWDNVPLPAGEKINSIKFVNDKCFFSTVSNNKTNCWVLDEALIPKLLDSSITSIDNISYLPEIESYLNITLAGANLAKRVYIFNSQDGVEWHKSDFSISGNTDYNLDNSDFETLNLNGKIFLRLGKETYVTSNGSFWLKSNNYGNFKTLKYSGAYFYNINNSKDVFVSKDGVGWNNFSLPNEINTLSSINIFDNLLTVSHVDYNAENKIYTTTVYMHSISSYDEYIPDIDADNTNYSVGALTSQYINSQQAASMPQTNDEQNNKFNKSMVFKINSNEMKVLDSSTSKLIDEVKLSVAPIIENDTAMLPLRDIITYIGGTLEWNSKTQTTKVNLNNKTIELATNSNQIKIEGKVLNMAVKPKIVNERVMVAIRPIVEQFGFEVKWKSETNEIIITN